jgi:hypothetical protein
MKKSCQCFLLMVLLPIISHADTLEVIRHTDEYQSPDLTPPPSHDAPDESILWALFHAKKIGVLKKQIIDLKSRYPDWQVPEDLQKALRSVYAQGQLSQIDQSKFRRNSHFRKPYLRSAKQINTCTNLDDKWDKAEFAAYQNQMRAVRLYQQLISICQDRQISYTTLQKAAPYLNQDEYFQLIDFAYDFLPENDLTQLKYQWLKNDYLHKTTLTSFEQQSAVAQLDHFIEQYQDDSLAGVIAWRYFDLQDYQSAYYYFNKAAQWHPENQSLVTGMMLSQEKLGNTDQVINIFTASTNPNSDSQAIAARIYKQKAWQSFKDKDLISAKDYAAKAQALENDDDLEIKTIQAWVANGGQQYEQAAKLFETLYQASPTSQNAQNYIQSQAKVDSDKLQQHAINAGGALQEEFNKYSAEQLYYRKQFLSAYQTAPAVFPKLSNIDSPYVDIGGYDRYKTGQVGLGQLNFGRLPIAGSSYTYDGIHNFKVDFSNVDLYSGTAGYCSAAIGSLDPTQTSAHSCLNSYRGGFSPTSHTNGLEANFSYRKDGWFSPYLKVGNTPAGGVVSPTVTFDTGFIQQAGFGNWGLNVYSQPVRQSILSYTGIQDPYQNGLTQHLPAGSNQLQWGRVLRSGVKANSYYQINENWGLAGSAEIAVLNGVNVANNNVISASASLGRNLDLADFSYFKLGPSLIFEHYQKNLSYFTLGQGGYFSPDQYYNVGFGANFLTQEGRSFIIKGRAVAGAQFINNASSPWFPTIAPGLGSYGAYNVTGEALDFELKGAWLITPNFQVGGGAAYRHTNNFEDYTGGLFFRYFFQERKASYSTDIPDGMFSIMQSY